MRLIRHVSLCILHSAFCIALALAAAVLPAAQPGTATLTVSGYTGTSTLADFPVLVRVPSAITLQCGPDGSALRFYAADGTTELAHQIDTWRYGYESYVWVKLPALAAGTTFTMAYGGDYGARATTDADVWTGYLGVWHLNETVSNGGTQTVDSSGNFAAGKTTGSRVVTKDGLVGKSFCACDAAAWNLTNASKLAIPNSPSKLYSPDGFSVSWWANSYKPGKIAAGGKGYVFSNTKWNVWFDTDGTESCRFNFSATGGATKTLTVEDAEEDFNTNVWIFAACTVDPGNGTATGRIYANGVLKATDTSFQLPASNTGDFVVGNGSGNKWYPGRIDELRVRGVASSVDWLKAEYDSVHNAAFVAFDSVPSLDFYVVPAGTTGNTPTVPYDTWATAANDFATLSASLPTTDAPATIHVAPGTYDVASPIPLSSTGITLTSDDGTGATARETTILDGGYPARTNRIATVTAANVTIRGLTFRNCMLDGTEDGGAIYTDSSSEKTSIIDCSFTNCRARYGGAIRLGAAKAWLEGCDFNDCHASTSASNTARHGGGVNVSAAATGAVITNCSFTGCTAYQGGAVKAPIPTQKTDFSERADYTIISGCTFTRNAPVRQNDNGNPVGGGICGKAWVENCRFDANYTPDGSCFNPAIAFDHSSVITNCVFENHSSANRGIVGPHGGNEYEARVVDCVFRGNTCGNMLGDQSIITADRCVFTNNAATSKLFWSGSKHVLRNSLYAYNWQPLRLSSVRFENCTVVSNTYGIYFGEKDYPVLVNCYVGGNTNPPTRFNNYRGNANFGYFETGWDNTTSSFVFDFHATNCVFEGAHTLEQRNTRYSFDLFDYEPSGTCEAITDLVAAKGAGFVDAANGDWRLRRRSPLRDAGLPLDWMVPGATDLDGQARLTDRFGKPFAPGALPDIGCYECQERTPYSTTILLR